MERILGAASVLIIVLASATTCLCEGYAEVFYTVNEIDVSNHVWQYSYTVVNPPLAADPADSGIVDTSGGGISWFNTYFPTDKDGSGNYLYSKITAITETLPPGWRSAGVVEPGTSDLFGMRGVYGASGDVDWPPQSILPGDSLSNFDVTFTYTGSTPPGPQTFEVMDPGDYGHPYNGYTWYKVLYTGTTSPLSVPEPLSVFMLSLSLFGLSIMSRKR